MNLKRIELRGFKSFADRSTIDFLDGVTCIVGPNGCGKSNIIDAIRWVLGEQRTGALRARRMEDVIFSGTQHRDPLNYAEVNLIFDNAEGFFDQGLKEMSLKRVLHRSGESNYYINGQVVRLKDVRELLMDSGIGVSGYSLISQGDIEDILRDNKFNRRKIFEEASGISLFHHKKEEAQRRLLRVRDHLLRLQDLFGEIDSRLEPLRIASEKAQEYIGLRDELKAMEIHFGLIDYDRYKNEQNELEREIRRLRSDLEAVQRLREERLEQKQELESNLSLQETEQQVLREHIQLQVEARDELALKLRVSEEKQNNSQKRRRELEELLERQQTSIEAQTSECQALETQLQISQATQAKKAEELELLEARLSGLRRELQVSGKTKEELSELIAQLKLEQERLKSSVLMLDEQQAEREQSLSELQREAKMVKIDRRKLEDDSFELSDQASELQLYLERTENQIAERSAAQNQLEQAIEAIDEELRELDLKRRLSEEKIGLLDTLADSAEHAVTQRILDSDIPLKGQLIEHLKIKPGYEKAIEASLGRAFYDQLLSDADKVPPLMELLRGKDYPQMGFLVPSLIRDKQIELPQAPGVLGLASDFVTGQGEGFVAIQKLLQNTIVMETMEQALQLGVKATIVTLAGESIKPSGAVTSAKSESRALNLLEERERLARLLEQIEQKHAELEPLIQQLDADESGQAKQLKELNLERDEILERQADVRRKQTEVEQSSALVLFQTTQLEESLQAQQNQLEDLSKRRSQTLIRIEEIKAQQEQALSEQQPVVESDRQADYDDLLQAQMELRLQLARLDEESNQVQARSRDASQRLDQALEALLETQDQQRELKQEADALQSEIDQWQEELATKKLELSEQDARAAKYQQQIQSLRSTIKELDQLLFEQGDQNQAKQTLLSQKEVQFTRSEERQNAISDDLWAKYELSILQLRDYVKDIEITKGRNHMRSLRQQMIALEPVHLGAIEEYAELQERHTFLETQMADVKASERDINQTIRSLETKMKTEFQETFDEIRGHYQEIFTELFQGGHGDIKLEDPENILESDIVILSSPPGKKLQHMNLLSGGEKALTAIALLFSVLRAKPAPFYVLDEIEAALDDINIARFGRFLDEFSKGSQFILITHRKGTMEFARALYGVSMEEKGVSKTVSLELVS